MSEQIPEALDLDDTVQPVEPKPTKRPKQPQDHKLPAGAYAFSVAGKRHVLPAIGEDAASEIPAQVTYDAIMNPDADAAQLRLALATLAAAKPKKSAMDALLSLSTKEMLEHVGAWMGESGGSSD